MDGGGMDRRRRSLWFGLVALLSLSVVLTAGAWAVGRVRDQTGAAPRRPVVVDEVPRSIPRQGVLIDQGLQVWMPARPTDVPAMSASEALAAVRKMANGIGVTLSTPLLARATIPSSEPPEGGSPGVSWLNVNDRLVWVIVARAPEPQHLPLGMQPPPPGGPPATPETIVVQNDNFVLDATTGEMLNGFFTK